MGFFILLTSLSQWTTTMKKQWSHHYATFFETLQSQQSNGTGILLLVSKGRSIDGDSATVRFLLAIIFLRLFLSSVVYTTFVLILCRPSIKALCEPSLGPRRCVKMSPWQERFVRHDDRIQNWYNETEYIMSIYCYLQEWWMIVPKHCCTRHTHDRNAHTHRLFAWLLGQRDGLFQRSMLSLSFGIWQTLPPPPCPFHNIIFHMKTPS